ncbi:PREDICTED: uncharacterized protein LOC108614920 [Drosophila arizonae]|uniref:Uncharacterized protein LOC108614920 n=1 Tax=Drosophila arizonae TaxID=7263 RepID=A0ABM1PBP1_DROAR|nr:PREDICTED: uncharacterized protein LOC108614920 [Drosophila arizonae]
MFRLMALLILGLAVNLNIAKNRNLRLRWSTFECQVHSDYISEYKCDVVQPRRSAFNVELNLLQELKAVKIHSLISTTYTTAGIYQKLFENTLNACRVISQVSRKGIISNIYSSIIKATNQPTKCPISKGLLYYYNISVEEAMPSFVPVSHLMTQVHFFDRNQCYLNITLEGTVSNT